MKPPGFLVLAASVMILSCSQKQEPVCNSRLLIYTTDLKNDSSAIAAYEHYHQPQNVWPEVTQAAKNAGFENIRIYRFNKRLVMVLQLPADADKRKMDSLYTATSPRLKEWAKLTGDLQQGPPGSKSGETWVEMKELYQYQK